MSGLEVLAIQAAPYILSAAGSAVAGVSAMGEGKAGAVAGRQAAEFTAGQLEREAAEDRAAAQRAAMEEEAKAELVQSRRAALAAASGAGAGASLLDMYEDTEARAQYLADIERYKGESKARGNLDHAAATRVQAGNAAAASIRKGDAAFVGTMLEATGTAAKGYAEYRYPNSRRARYG